MTIHSRDGQPGPLPDVGQNDQNGADPLDVNAAGAPDGAGEDELSPVGMLCQDILSVVCRETGVSENTRTAVGVRINNILIMFDESQKREQEAKRKLSELKSNLRRVNEKLAVLQQEHFGASSEKGHYEFGDDDPGLCLDDEDEVDEERPKGKRVRKIPRDGKQVEVHHYPCDGQVGSAGFKIDLGVRHPDQPGRYILAVECDGATYHSALWARERDRLRQDVLEGLGWRFHRIWSTDWFHRRASEIDRLRAALEAAAQSDGPEFTGVNDGGRLAPQETAASDGGSECILPPPPDLSAPYYVASSFKVPLNLEPHLAPMTVLTDLVTRVVEAEGPVHQGVIARRVAAAFGKAQAGRRIRQASDEALTRATRSGRILVEEEFAMTPAQRDETPVRDRSRETAPIRQADALPPIEIRAAAARVVAESGEMPREELIVATARLLGFARVGQDLRGVIDVSIAEPNR